MFNLEVIPQLFVSGLGMGCVYALAALGFQIIWRASGILNFSLGPQVVIGMLLLYSFRVTLGLNLWVAFFLSAVIAIIIGAIFERLFISPAIGASEHAPVIVTLGGLVFLQGLWQIIWGPQALFASPFSTGEPLSFCGALIEIQYIWIVGLTIIVLIGVFVLYRYTMWGRALRAASMNIEGAKVIGVNTGLIPFYVFGMGAGLCALAGAMVAPLGAARFDLGLAYGLKGFAACLFGGLASPVTVVIGGLLIGFIEVFSILFTQAFRDVVLYSIIIIVLAFRPEGIFGKKIG